MQTAEENQFSSAVCFSTRVGATSIPFRVLKVPQEIPAASGLQYEAEPGAAAVAAAVAVLVGLEQVSESALLPAREAPEAVEPQLFPAPLDGQVRELAPLHEAQVAQAQVEPLLEVQEPALGLGVPEASRRLPAAEALEEEDRIQTLPRICRSDRTIFQWPGAATRLSPGT